jgi:hypothetical protein
MRGCRRARPSATCESVGTHVAVAPYLCLWPYGCALAHCRPPCVRLNVDPHTLIFGIREQCRLGPFVIRLSPRDVIGEQVYSALKSIHLPLLLPLHPMRASRGGRTWPCTYVRSYIRSCLRHECGPHMKINWQRITETTMPHVRAYVLPHWRTHGRKAGRAPAYPCVHGPFLPVLLAV